MGASPVADSTGPGDARPREDWSEHQRRVMAVLGEADAAFIASGDALDALSWVQLAARAGVPLPPALAAWLYDGIQQFRAGNGTLDSALSLTKSGAADPRRRRSAAALLQASLGRMFVLHTLGATVDDAALMVSRLDARMAHGTLVDRYVRSGLGPKARATGSADVARVWSHASALEATLAEYPDRPPELKAIKDKIRALYAKRST